MERVQKCQQDEIGIKAEQLQNIAVYVNEVSSQKPIKRLKQSNGGIFSCDRCEFSGLSRQVLWSHKKSKHEGVRYPCDQCEYATTSLSNLKQHKETKHEGVRYVCDRCEYVATRLSNLKRHKDSKHADITYQSDECIYAATNATHLNQEYGHKGSVFNECENIVITPDLPEIKEELF